MVAAPTLLESPWLDRNSLSINELRKAPSPRRLSR